MPVGLEHFRGYQKLRQNSMQNCVKYHRNPCLSDGRFVQKAPEQGNSHTLTFKIYDNTAFRDTVLKLYTHTCRRTRAKFCSQFHYDITRRIDPIGEFCKSSTFAFYQTVLIYRAGIVILYHNIYLFRFPFRATTDKRSPPMRTYSSILRVQVGFWQDHYYKI